MHTDQDPLASAANMHNGAGFFPSVLPTPLANVECRRPLFLEGLNHAQLNILGASLAHTALNHSTAH